MGRWGTEGGAEGAEGGAEGAEGGVLVAPAVRALRGVLERFETEEARLRGLAYEVRAGDVFIATPPKCGTTWMQQVRGSPSWHPPQPPRAPRGRAPSASARRRG